jgi:hypothetical protein
MHKEVMEVVAYLRETDPMLAANALEQIVRQAPRPHMVRPLTTKQRRVFDFVRAYITMQGCPPTLYHIATHFGYRALSTASEHLSHLQEKGWIVRETDKPGTIQITPGAANA